MSYDDRQLSPLLADLSRIPKEILTELQFTPWSHTKGTPLF